MAWDNARPRSRKYGLAKHRNERSDWARRHQPDDPCTRCGHPLGPMGPWLHLDHDDVLTDQVNGFAHGDPCPWCGVRCNVSAGARKARALQSVTRIDL